MCQWGRVVGGRQMVLWRKREREYGASCYNVEVEVDVDGDVDGEA